MPLDEDFCIICEWWTGAEAEILDQRVAMILAPFSTIEGENFPKGIAFEPFVLWEGI